jgi:hypothetical protein
MKKTSLAFVAVGLFAMGCDGRDPTGPVADDRLVNPQFNGAGVVHRVSVGSHDFVPPGVDANFSLAAIQYSDGRMKGQWSDQFGHGNNGLHVVIDCVHVIANQAWLGGMATDKTFKGMRVLTKVVDNGTSPHEPPDEISFSVVNPAQFGLSEDCRAVTAAPFPLFPLPAGEVKVE